MSLPRLVLIAACAALFLPQQAGAQSSYEEAKAKSGGDPQSVQVPGRNDTLPKPRQPRRQFVTFSVDGMRNLPLHFRKYPLEQLVGRDLSQSREGAFDYHSDDGHTQVDVIRYRTRNSGFGVTVYPFGAGNGTSLAIRASTEQLPVTEFVAYGPATVSRYRLSDGRALDVGVGVVVTDRSAGWGLGSHTFVLAGAGRLSGERGGGRRLFAEGGGGINVGPFGMQLAVKIGYNRLSDPIEHSFFTMPVTLRGTLSF